MCGRYYIDDGMDDEVERLLDEINRDLGRSVGRREGHPARITFAVGDIHPSNHAVVLTKGPSGIAVCTKRWGFCGWDGKGLVINARAETVMEKNMFKESMQCRRCVVPASGFYEWNREKEKFTFCLPQKRPMFFAGIYRRFPEDEGERYVILTTQANTSMKPVHPRMPLILRRNQVKLWLGDVGGAKQLLAAEPEGLRREAEYEQMRLDFLR